MGLPLSRQVDSSAVTTTPSPSQVPTHAKLGSNRSRSASLPMPARQLSIKVRAANNFAGHPPALTAIRRFSGPVAPTEHPYHTQWRPLNGPSASAGSMYANRAVSGVGVPRLAVAYQQILRLRRELFSSRYATELVPGLFFFFFLV